VAISWVLSQSSPGAPVIAIPGATSVARVEENMKEVQLDKDDMEDIAEILYKIPVEGGRYGGHAATTMDG
jgi:pyridoxine 4-dehydrogenase